MATTKTRLRIKNKRYYSTDKTKLGSDAQKNMANFEAKVKTWVNPKSLPDIPKTWKYPTM